MRRNKTPQELRLLAVQDVLARRNVEFISLEEAKTAPDRLPLTWQGEKIITALCAVGCSKEEAEARAIAYYKAKTSL